MSFNQRIQIVAWSAFAVVGCLIGSVAGQDGLDPNASMPNWKMQTLGGSQFWTDLWVVSEWRVQQNSETGHCRLLDPEKVRHAWGGEQYCRNQLKRRIEAGTVQLPQGKVAILLHGLVRTSTSMEPLAVHLRKHGYGTINFGYASTREKVGDHAEALKSVIDGLGPHVNEVYLVGHSLGNLVVRRYLGDTADQAKRIQGDQRIQRIVMLGPPNHGSRMARLLKRSVLFNTLAGKSGQQLASGWEALEPTLAVPEIPFGIVAGGQDNINFSNLILRGPDDFTVALSEAKLNGADDLFVRPLFHSTMMHQPEVMSATVKFLEHGYFVAADQRQPVPAAAEQSSVSPAANNE
jgi:hypothetical protein